LGEEAPLAGVPNLALRAERAPNARGADLLGYSREYAAAVAAAETAAVVLVLDQPDIAVRTAGALLYVGTVLPERARDAQAVLPIANVAEEEGTYVNRDGRVQRYFQAKSAPGMARPAWWVFSELATALSGGPGGHVGTAAEAFERLAASVEAFRGLSYARLGFAGAPVPAVVPFAAPLPTPWGDVDMVVANLPVGFLYILAFGSLGVYGIVLAGWSSNNKYSLLGGLRASAQMISYEIALGMSTVAVLLLAGNVTLTDVIAKQAQSLFTWNVFPLSLAFFIFIVAAFAETNRLPFDLPEAEGELIAGYHTEYSAMKFSMFYIAEYSNMVTASALMTTLFFGGWDIPFTTWDNAPPWTVVKTIATLAVFTVKVGCLLFLFIWVRWTLPRFRYDQLMALGWKVMLPLALGYVTVIATAI